MIDYIKITLRNFTGSLDNCRRVADEVHKETGIIYENYRLPNHRQTPKQHRMKVARQAGSQTLYVKGSIRKWCNHRDTLADLTASSFESTMKKLAQKLNIPFEELCQAKFTQCEIGMSIRTSIPCCEIIPMVVRYGGLQKNEKRSWEYESVYFDGKAKKLKIYDKGKEIADKARGITNRPMMKRVSDWLRENEYNYLRIECTLPHRKGFTQYGLGHIETVGSLIANYSDLYTFWSRETNRIAIYNPATVPNKEKLKAAEFKIAMNLALHGFEKEYKQNEERIKDYVPSSRSRAREKLFAVVNKFYLSTYNTQTLRLDAARNLTRKHAKLGVEIPINACYRALWVEKMVKRGSSL